MSSDVMKTQLCAYFWSIVYRLSATWISGVSRPSLMKSSKYRSRLRSSVCEHLYVCVCRDQHSFVGMCKNEIQCERHTACLCRRAHADVCETESARVCLFV